MNEPIKAGSLLASAHRMVADKQRVIYERSWSCRRCEDRGIVREAVGYRFGNRDLVVDAVARCRCAAGEKQSPNIAVCSDAFWWGMSAEEAEQRKAGLLRSEPAPVRQDFQQPNVPTPWAGTQVEEWDP